MTILGIVRDASGVLLDHAALHAELLRVEWAEEKRRRMYVRQHNDRAGWLP